MKTIDLTEDEIFEAAIVGVTRRLRNLMKNAPDPVGPHPSLRWGNDIEGACGERAFAKAANLYWPGVGAPRAHDVSGYQIRTALGDDLSLIVYERDADDDVYILVTGPAPRLTVCGWMTAAEAKQPQHWNKHARYPAFFVKPQHLHAMGELKRRR